MKTVSIFAAMTWSPASRPALPREKRVFLGRMSTIVEVPASGWWSRTTKSPTAGNRPSMSTSHTVFCRQATRPARYGPVYFEKALSCSSVQPRSSSV